MCIFRITTVIDDAYEKKSLEKSRVESIIKTEFYECRKYENILGREREKKNNA